MRFLFNLHSFYEILSTPFRHMWCLLWDVGSFLRNNRKFDLSSHNCGKYEYLLFYLSLLSLSLSLTLRRNKSWCNKQIIDTSCKQQPPSKRTQINVGAKKKKKYVTTMGMGTVLAETATATATITHNITHTCHVSAYLENILASHVLM